jgi:ZIP family zinc transporter
MLATNKLNMSSRKNKQKQIQNNFSNKHNNILSENGTKKSISAAFSEEKTNKIILSKKMLLRTGILTALATAIHNFPEGLATFMSALYQPTMAISIVIAIAIHNIPEGISVSIPIFYATKSKKKAFFYSFLSGMAEPVGAILGYFVFKAFFNEIFFGIIFALIAGMMVYIALVELLPSALNFSKKHCFLGLFCGMLIMAVSLLLFL